MMADLPRRSLIRGIGAFLAAPAIVRVASLMPVRPLIGMPALYRTTWVHMDVQAMRDRNVLLRAEDYWSPSELSAAQIRLRNN